MRWLSFFFPVLDERVESPLIFRGQITQVVACDRADDSGSESLKLYKRATTMNANELRSDLRRFMKEEIAALKKEVYASTGTSTDSRGPVRPAEPMDPVDA